MDQFPVDVFQGGAGTSVNMNTNEVVANLALELLGYDKGRYDVINPNDHVNKSQSTNDAYPTGFRVAIHRRAQFLIEAISLLAEAFEAKGEEFDGILKMGRTQLQDAVPMTLGQEFRGFATNLREEIRTLRRVSLLLLEVNLGATAIGTGLNTPDGYARVAANRLAEVTGLPDRVLGGPRRGDLRQRRLRGDARRGEARGGQALEDLQRPAPAVVGATRGAERDQPPGAAGGLVDHAGQGEPGDPRGRQPGLLQGRRQRRDHHDGGRSGQLQLNVMEPGLAQSMFESFKLLTNACDNLRESCVVGITANPAVCASHVLQSIGIVTYLNEVIGHHNGDLVGAECARSDRTVREVVLEMALLGEEAARPTALAREPAASSLPGTRLRRGRARPARARRVIRTRLVLQNCTSVAPIF
jgi:aspartate ammonia-lyase